MKSVAIAAMVLAASITSAAADMMLNGVAQLLKACTRADYEWIGFCNGYIQAAFDATGGKAFAPPRA